MAWARVDDQWWAHPKVLGLSIAARGLWVTSLSWSCGQRRDAVPVSLVRMVADDPNQGFDLAEELVAAGLWDVVADGWLIHDWAEYQDRSISEVRAEAGRKGAEKRWQTDGKPMANHGADQGEPTPEPDGKPMANAVATDGKVDGRSHPVPSRPIPSHPVRTSSATDVDKPSRERPRDPYFDAACAALDMPERGNHEGVVGTIAAKARNGDHQPDEILRRAALHLATFGFPLTPGSLNKRWDELGSKVVTATPAERKRVQAEIERMRNRERISEALPEAMP